MREGKRWNSDFAVHVNATESYPVANAFSETLVDKDDEQWDWLDQSYRIDARRDLVSGDIARRFRQLREETDAGLNTLYIDVFRESGWNSDRLQRELRAQGWHVTTEWGHGLERSSLWSHWATETDYGPDTSRGINSRLIRFMRNHQKDVFADKELLLGIPRTGNFEGWVGKVDWNAFYQQIWTDSLPAKYLQAYPIRSWHAHQITFFGPGATTVSDADGQRTITTVGRVVYAGGAYLLPWKPRDAADPAKLYHYNPRGGSTTWHLPRGWSDARQVTLYRLTDQGRPRVGRLPVRGGKVTVAAEAATPYVVYRDTAPPQSAPHWGAHTPVRDPGFHARRLAGQRPRAGGPRRARRLRTGHRRRRAGIRLAAARPPSTTWPPTARRTPASNACSPASPCPRAAGPVELTLRAAAGAARVRFDNVRVVPTRHPRGHDRDVLVHEDFEHVPHGWGPFVKGDAGGTNDPRTHIAQRHAPYTQRGWNGKAVDDVLDGGQSLKSLGEKGGLVYRTVPHTVRFRPGRRYEVSFRYANERADQYAWITGVDEPAPRELSRAPLPVATAPTRWRHTFTAPSEGDAWVGLRNVGDDGKAEFVLDAFTVRELD